MNGFTIISPWTPAEGVSSCDDICAGVCETVMCIRQLLCSDYVDAMRVQSIKHVKNDDINDLKFDLYQC